MDRQDIITPPREHEADPRARGMVHVSLFGSRTRGDGRHDSGTDITIPFDPEARIGAWGYAWPTSIPEKNMAAGSIYRHNA